MFQLALIFSLDIARPKYSFFFGLKLFSYIACKLCIVHFENWDSAIAGTCGMTVSSRSGSAFQVTRDLNSFY